MNSVTGPQKMQPEKDDGLQGMLSLGASQRQAGALAAAAQTYRSILAQSPNSRTALNCLSQVLLDQGDAPGALLAGEHALALDPQCPDSLISKGNALARMGETKAAADLFQSAIATRPEDPFTWFNLAMCRAQLGAFDAAEPAFLEALRQRPDWTQALDGLGRVRALKGDHTGAAATFDLLRRLDANYPGVAYNLGTSLAHGPRPEAALDVLRDAVRQQPGDVLAHENLTIALLREGAFEEGWAEYQWRFARMETDAPGRLPPVPSPDPRHNDGQSRRGYSVPWWRLGPKGDRLPQPIHLWNGEPLQGKSLLLYAEQGVGDEIMFTSLIPDVLARGPAQVFLECDPRLRPLFQRSFPSIYVQGKDRSLDVTWIEQSNHPDFCLPLGDLPLFFRKDVADFQPQACYLMAEETTRYYWRERLEKLERRLKIGISWRGGSTPESRARRSVGFDYWRRIVSEETTLISLQYGATEDEIKTAETHYGVPLQTWPDFDPREDLDELSALICELDLVITVDNSTAHLAGALGVPTWVVVGPDWDWRWPQVFGKGAPFSASVRVFRAETLGHWDDAMGLVSATLAERGLGA